MRVDSSATLGRAIENLMSHRLKSLRSHANHSRVGSTMSSSSLISCLVPGRFCSTLHHPPDYIAILRNLYFAAYDVFQEG
jgi:hypothetical protein